MCHSGRSEAKIRNPQFMDSSFRWNDNGCGRNPETGLCLHKQTCLLFFRSVTQSLFSPSFVQPSVLCYNTRMNPQKLYTQALEKHKNGQINDAIDDLRTLIESDARFEDAYEVLSVMLYNQKRYDEAIAVIQAWIKVNGDLVMAFANLSRCYVEKGMILEAEKAQAESLHLSWKAQLTDKKAEAPKQDFKQRIERYQKVIEFDPKDVLGYFSLGTVYLEAGMPRQAAETFKQAAGVNWEHSASHFGWGQALEAVGDLKQAVNVYVEGMKVAHKQGDMLTVRKIESRLKALES